MNNEDENKAKQEFLRINILEKDMTPMNSWNS